MKRKENDMKTTTKKERTIDFVFTIAKLLSHNRLSPWRLTLSPLAQASDQFYEPA